jgi:GT2 family glycosyltransferase
MLSAPPSKTTRPADAEPVPQKANAPLISVVSATRNRPDSVRRLIDSIRHQSIDDLEIIIVDDGSDSPLAIEDEDVILIHTNINVGPCAARNVGMRAARGKFIFLCDDDIELIDRNMLRSAIDLANRHPQFGAIGFKHFDESGNPHLNQPAHTAFAVSNTIFYSYGVLLRRDAVLAVGGFNESIRYCYEEQELGFRLHDAGWKIMFAPSLTLVHHHDPRGRNWKKIHRLITLNAYRTILMRFPAIWVLPAAIYKLAIFPIETARRGSPDFTGTLWLWTQAIRWIGPCLRDRAPIRYSTFKNYLALKRHPLPIEQL